MMNAEMEGRRVEQPRARPLPGEDGYGCFFIGALIGAGASLIGGAMGKDSAEDAADTNAAAQAAAIEEQRRQFDLTRADLAPYREVGGQAVNRLGTEVGTGEEPGDLTRQFQMSDYEADPGYQFRLAEGNKAIERAANARGQWTNPATVKELTRYGQGLASDEFGNAFNRFQVGQGNRFNRLAALSGVGQTAVNTGAQVGANAANAMSNIYQTGGQLQAQNRMDGANAMIGGLTGGVSSAIDQYNANRYRPQFTTSPAL